MMEFTGERYVPNYDSAEISYEHWHRYLFAAQFVARRKVLDVACGEGYGSAWLARTAESVVGVDIDRRAVDYAAQTYGRENLEFRCGRADVVPIDGRQTCDVIVSFETIEHLSSEEQEGFLAEVQRLLRPDGLFIVSTPNRPLYSDARHYANEFHKREFDECEFVACLQTRFPNVRLFGQKVYPASIIWTTDASRGTAPECQIAFEEGRFSPVQGDRKEMLYMLALCSAGPLDFDAGSLMLDISERATFGRERTIAEREGTIRSLSAQLAAAGEQAARGKEAESRAGKLAAAIDGLTADLEMTRQNRDAVAAAIADREESIGRLQGRLNVMRARYESSERERDALHEQLAAQGAELASLGRAVVELREAVPGIAEEVRNIVSGEAARLREALQGELASRHDALRNEIAELRQSLESDVAELRETIHMRSEETLVQLYNLPGSQNEPRPEYRLLLARIRQSVCSRLPRSALVAIGSKGDDELLRTCGRKAWHFPRNADGTYPGFYPGDSLAAIAQLEAARGAGATHFLLPVTSLWWLDAYPAFARYLERHFEKIVHDANSCLIYALADRRSRAAVAGGARIAAFLDEFRDRFGRDPAVLDISGADLAAAFPRLAVLTAEKNVAALPYLDHSIDAVLVLRSDAELLAEARRVAEFAIVIAESRDLASGRAEVEWRTGASAPAPRLVPSIIVPVYNGLEHTENCLRSLCETLPPDWDAEVIVVDDASSGDVARRLDDWAARDARIRVLHNEQNLGFLGSVNRGAAAARGDILVLLNNDTLLLGDWLPPLLATFSAFPDAGAAGGRLLYPDGRLQEAGGVVFCDGSAAQFGHNDYTPDAALYRAVREVDYCSGALLATPRRLFEELGGLDPVYGFGYYEDTDYCFRVRERGLRVYYQPESAIIHLEGGSCGIDVRVGLKRSQVENREHFCRRWRAALADQPDPPPRYDRGVWHQLAARGRREEQTP